MYFHCLNLFQGCWMCKDKLPSQILKPTLKFQWLLLLLVVVLNLNYIPNLKWQSNLSKDIYSSLVHGLSEVKINREISDRSTKQTSITLNSEVKCALLKQLAEFSKTKQNIFLSKCIYLLHHFSDPLKHFSKTIHILWSIVHKNTI